jgi:hypothetical protein
MRLGERTFERQAGVFDAARRRRAGAPLHAADVDDIRAGLRDADGDGADVRDPGIFTLMRARGLICRRLWITCARSSME